MYLGSLPGVVRLPYNIVQAVNVRLGREGRRQTGLSRKFKFQMTLGMIAALTLITSKGQKHG